MHALLKEHNKTYTLMQSFTIISSVRRSYLTQFVCIMKFRFVFLPMLVSIVLFNIGICCSNNNKYTCAAIVKHITSIYITNIHNNR